MKVFTTIAILLTLMVSACTDELIEPEHHRLEGTWRMYIPWHTFGPDTIWTPYYYTFNEDGSGQELLSGYYLYPLEWEADDDLLEITWIEDGSGYSCPYEFVNDTDILLRLKTGDNLYRKVE